MFKTSAGVQVTRFPTNPLISKATLTDTFLARWRRSPVDLSNINGPSLISVPSWIKKPLGKYYLYFAHHHGKFIRLAYADRIQGPWTISTKQVLPLSEVDTLDHHIASPDVHVDEQARQLRMYFHGPWIGAGAQRTGVACSDDGLHFSALNNDLGPPYFRVFRHKGQYYSLAMDEEGGRLLRSADGLTPFEAGPVLVDRMRHAAVEVVGDTLEVFFTRLGDSPESILRTEVALSPDWKSWQMKEISSILQPEELWEGGGRPVTPGLRGAAAGVCGLRDPCIFSESGARYLIYAGGGEEALGGARLT